MQGSCFAPRHDYSVTADIDNHAIARVCHVRLYADEDPMLAEDEVEVGGENVGIRIEGSF
jgi:hypothetical protein